MSSEAPAVPLEELRSRFNSICSQKRIGWHAQRVFLRTLGVGGQGVVYLSERSGSSEFKLPLALKVFSPDRYSNANLYREEMRRLTHVAAVVAQVQQDEVVTVQNVVSHRGLYLMEMEWIDGYDLQRLLRREALKLVKQRVTERRWQDINDQVVTPGADDARLRPGAAVNIMRACLRGLAALHRADIVHCDVKPSNIMLKRTGSVKLIDIGSAYLRHTPPAGNPCTPEYAAPEVLSGQRATEQSDLASLGYVLIEIITGSHPFSGLTYGQLLRAKQSLLKDLPALMPVEEFAFSEPLIRLLQRLIHPDPAKRFLSAEDAETAPGGAADFLRELVKSDLPDGYTHELRNWIASIDSGPDLNRNVDPSSDQAVPDGTTRLYSPRQVDLD